jgi:hypothetical protein
LSDLRPDGRSTRGDRTRARGQQLSPCYPRDALPLSLALGAFGLYAFSGRAEHDELRLELCRRLAPHYGEDWWMLTHLGWSHTEAGRLADGARITERALEARQRPCGACLRAFLRRGTPA